MLPFFLILYHFALKKCTKTCLAKRKNKYMDPGKWNRLIGYKSHETSSKPWNFGNEYQNSRIEFQKSYGLTKFQNSGTESWMLTDEFQKLTCRRSFLNGKLGGAASAARQKKEPTMASTRSWHAYWILENSNYDPGPPNVRGTCPNHFCCVQLI